MREKSPRLLSLPPIRLPLGNGQGEGGFAALWLHPEIPLHPDEGRAVIFQQFPLIWSRARSRTRQFKGSWAAAGSCHHSCPISVGHSTIRGRRAEDLKPSVSLKKIFTRKLCSTQRGTKKDWELCRGMERARYEGEVLLLMCQCCFGAFTLK